MSEIIKKYSDKMDKTINSLTVDFGGIRAGRANPHILDKISVDYYGTMTPVAQVGNIAVPEARMITITPWEPKMAEEIGKAISTSDIGINPIIDGNIVRLNFPELTEERRKEISKDVKKRGEDAKVAIRNIRRDGNDECKKLKKLEDISEDTIKDLQDELQKTTDLFIKKIDELVEDKVKEIMTV